MYQNHTFVQPYNYSRAFEHLPHKKLQNSIARDRYVTRYLTYEMYQESLRNYYALISHIDDACEGIVDELINQGIYDETLIIVTADNGLMLGAHGLAGKKDLVKILGNGELKAKVEVTAHAFSAAAAKAIEAAGGKVTQL